MASDFARTLKAEWQQSKILKKMMSNLEFYTQPQWSSGKRNERHGSDLQGLRDPTTFAPLLSIHWSFHLSEGKSQGRERCKLLGGKTNEQKRSTTRAKAQEISRRLWRGRPRMIATHQPQEARAAGLDQSDSKWWTCQQPASVTIPSVTEQDHQRQTRIPAVRKQDANWEAKGKLGAVWQCSGKRPRQRDEVPRKDASSKTRAAAAESPEPALSIQ